MSYMKNECIAVPREKLVVALACYSEAIN